MKKTESIFESKKGNKTLIGAIDADVLAFTVGKDPVLDLRLVEWDCLGSAAHVTMLSRIPVKPVLFTKDERDAVVAGLVEIMRASREGTPSSTAACLIWTAAPWPTASS